VGERPAPTRVRLPRRRRPLGRRPHALLLLAHAQDDDEADTREELITGDADMARTMVVLGEQALLEAEMAKGSADADASFLAVAQEAAVARAFTTHGSVYDSVMEELAQAQAGDAADAGSPEDVEGPRSVDALFTPDAAAGLAADRMASAEAQVNALKLSPDELRTLVPRDWDDSTVEWFTSRRNEDLPLPEFKLSFLWTDKNIAVAVDQVYARGGKSPLTEYFFWPRRDAWEDLKAALEARPWIAERDKVVLLNRLTEVINFWQEEEAKHSVDEARGAFPDCGFAGA